jgi:alanine racemase/UDP-N-acetylmuramoyl-tripeptide--D-alanyl-D-alanine ligase
MDPFDLRQWKGFVSAGGDPAHSAVTDQISIDSRRIDSPHALFVPLEGKIHDGHIFIGQAIKAGARFVLARKNWQAPPLSENVTLLRVDDPLRAFQEIAQAYRHQLNCKIVTIAGSYGKTMVKDLLHAMIGSVRHVVASPESFNSQIGVPLSLFTIRNDHEIAFIEAGISQKNEMNALVDMIAPDNGILTHIGKKHIATLGDRETVASEMIKLFLHQRMNQWAILPNDPLLNPFLAQLKASHYHWNNQNHQLPHARSLSAEHSSVMPYQVDFPDGNKCSGQITSGFYYFLDLINITSKAAWLLGLTSEQIGRVLRDYQPEPMRTEIWKSPVGTTFINDIYCSDPQSVDQSLKQLDQNASQGRKVFVFGGLKGHKQHPEIDYRRVGKAIHRSQVDLLMLVGNHPFDPLIEEVKTGETATEISLCPTYNDALNLMRARLKPNDVVLVKGEKKEPLDALTDAFNDSICNNQCIINLAAIQSNIETIRQKISKNTRIMVMVKALAYGTDEIRMAKFLSSCGVDILGVSYVDEGVVLKRAGVKQSIFVINAAIYEASKVVKWGLEVGVSDKGLIEAIAVEAAKQNKRIKVHLHVDTGMSRFGCRPEEALGLARLIRDCPSLEFEGIMTHFACADNPEDDLFTMSQARCFEETIQQIQSQGIHVPWKHAANSSGVMRFNFPQFNMVRIGLAVFGLYSSEATKKSMELRLALSLISRIVGINICKEGETISYGRSYTVNREMQRIAVLPIGYFDGLHRNYSGKGHVIVRGQKAPMVGKICMDFMMVDVTEISNATVGDSVLIFGEDEHGHYLSPEDLALRGDSIVYELITCLGPRIQRIFVHEEAHKLR